MRRKQTSLMLAASLASLLSIGSVHFAAAADGAKKDMTGEELAFDKSKGNCLACHAMPNVPGAEAPGNIAPPLVDMKARFPDKAKLRERIWDEMKFNPNTSMPPFGLHKILTEQEIDKVTDFIYGI